MAVTAREQEMLDLAERGLRPAEIAEQIGIKRASVERTLGLLNHGLGYDRSHEAAMALGSARLLEAMQAAGHC